MITRHYPGPELYLLLVAFAIFVPGCGAAMGPEDTGGDEPTGARTEASASVTTMMIPEPPGSTLSHGFRLNLDSREPDA